MINFALYWAKLAEQAMFYAPKIVIAIIVLVLGLWIISGIVGFVKRRLEKSKIDIALQKFLGSLLGVILKVLLIISVASMMGFEMASFVAIVAAAAFAIGLALQGSLANFAGGVLILIFKPFTIGDLIDAQGYLGKVSEIQIFNTILKTPDNKTVIIPNGPLSNGSITNFTTEENRRVDLTIGIGYDDNIDKARKVLEKIIAADKRIFKDPAPAVRVAELADSSVNFTVRMWAKGTDYWDIFFEMQETVKKEFDKAKIGIPYPQMDVHVHK